MKMIKIAAFSVAAVIAGSAQASTFVYEGFNYALSNNANMNGVTTNATGITGAYALGQQQAGLGTASFASTGLSFSNFSTTGGALTLSLTAAVNNTSRSAQLGAALNTGPITGTVWTSYLFQYGSVGSVAATAQTRINGAQTVSSNAHLTVLADGPQTAADGLLYGSETTATGTTNSLSLSTTYLALAKFTNVGTVGQTGTGNMWVFTVAGYNNWRSLGGGLEANLATYAVTGSVLSTSTTTSATNSTFDNSQFLSFAVSNASSASAETMTIDELRWGAVLADVTTVPEPSTYGIVVAMAMCGLAIARRRKMNWPTPA